MNESERIDRFLARYNELMDLRLLRNWRSAKLTVNYHHLAGLRLATENPDEEDLKSFLMTLRLFLQQGAPIHLGRIHNLVARNIRSDEVKRNLERALSDWKAFQKRGPFRIQEGSTEYSPEDITGMWINAEYFHDDESYRTLNRLRRNGPTAVLTRHTFLDYVIRATNQISLVRNSIVFGRHHRVLDL